MTGAYEVSGAGNRSVGKGNDSIETLETRLQGRAAGAHWQH